ncbi:choice-of-anchor I family protein [Larkinella soli]|uniref:choice-of-anchor I family protein n=1 Tax=Larkinella soli TaxID=1770527 RepID=UPI000FFCA1A2|nr:choice-of-anchor I family protein [Larkinella soli]
MVKKQWLASAGLITLWVSACITDHTGPNPNPENPGSFKQVASSDLGKTAAAEISAYDPISKRLFTVNNESVPKIDIHDLSALPTISKLAPIDLSALGGVANSVAVSGGRLAIALEALNKQDNGRVLVYDAASLVKEKEITVGALPDMVTWSPDGRYIVTANEGEPSQDYTNDPVGSVSIIDVQNGYSVKTLDFSGFESSLATLTAGGFRVFGPGATLAKDVEPEYVAISSDSQKAWVTLQENNGIAEVDLAAGTIQKIHPLGTKDFSLADNAIDPTNTGNTISFGTWPVKSFFLPDAISYFSVGGTGYLITADEGDAREYSKFVEQKRVSELNLDPGVFPNAATLKMNANLGRLNVTRTIGSTGSDSTFTALYGFGGRGFSIFNAATGQRIYEPGRTLEDKVVAAGKYDDGRSDDKGVEPEGVTVGIMNGKPVAFIALERADAIAIYDLSNPTNPQFLQLLATGDAPEGVLFVGSDKSPNGKSMLVVSSEEDGEVRIYQPE